MDDLLETANGAIEKLFSDTSVGRDITRERLRELQTQISSMIECLNEEHDG